MQSLPVRPSRFTGQDLKISTTASVILNRGDVDALEYAGEHIEARVVSRNRRFEAS